MAKEKSATLTLRIKRVWLEEIVFGKKRKEYRDNSKFYQSRLVSKDLYFLKYEKVYFYCPMGTTGKNLTAEIVFKETTYDEKDNIFVIHLGKILKHNLPKPKKIV